MSSRADMDSIVRRRRSLSTDYQDLTQTWLDDHKGARSRFARTASRCITMARRQFLPHYFASSPRWRIWVRQCAKERALPDFCIIGPIKSGTSDLAVTIMSHPNVLNPLVKEPPSKDPAAWKPYYPTISAVKRHARQHGMALCPFVAPYLHFVDLPIMLAALCPDAKIVINLRNPVDLVFSGWKWLVLHNEKTYIDRSSCISTFGAYVETALELFPATAVPLGSALHNGIYANSVAHWLRAFGEQNVRVFDIGEYFSDRNVYLERLQKFLALPYVAMPSRLPVANRNPLEDLAPDPKVSVTLKEFFEPYNRQLWDVIGAVYSW